LGGVATMWMAVFADTGTCLIVVANGMRMLRMKDTLDKMATAKAL
jgi:Cd2+/Zn2+-exporting ATPase